MITGSRRAGTWWCVTSQAGGMLAQVLHVTAGAGVRPGQPACAAHLVPTDVDA
jgi:hypothetical protein